MNEFTSLVKFITRILPPEGQGMRCIQVKHAGRFHKPVFFKTNEEAAGYALQKSGDTQAFDVFHHCATSNGLSRAQVNVDSVKALWLDIDCGESKDYTTQRDAIEAVMKFTACLRLPRPELVSSGGGVHVYWPLAEAVSSAIWKPIARGLRAKCINEGLRADYKCTADEARVLRTPFSYNNKPGREPKQVLWLPSTDGPITVTQARAAFGEVLDHYAGPAVYGAPALRRFGLHSDKRLTAALLVIPVTGLPVEIHRYMSEWIERGWDDAYGLWSNVGGAIRNTYGDAGFKVFDLWSSGDPSRYQGTEATYAKYLKLNHNRLRVGSVYQLAQEIKLARELGDLIEAYHEGAAQGPEARI